MSQVLMSSSQAISRQHAPSVSRQPTCFARQARTRLARRLSCNAQSSDEESSRLPEGTRVRVITELTVFHAPKQKDGLQMLGMEGDLVSWVDQYKGKVLSSNLPAKIKFKLEVGDKERTFFTHLDNGEFEAI